MKLQVVVDPAVHIGHARNRRDRGLHKLFIVFDGLVPQALCLVGKSQIVVDLPSVNLTGKTPYKLIVVSYLTQWLVLTVLNQLLKTEVMDRLSPDYQVLVVFQQPVIVDDRDVLGVLLFKEGTQNQQIVGVVTVLWMAEELITQKAFTVPPQVVVV